MGGLHGAEIPHELRGGLSDESPLLAEALGVGDAVVAVIRGTQTRELLGVRHPVELAAVHERPASLLHALDSGVGAKERFNAPLRGKGLALPKLADRKSVV